MKSELKPAWRKTSVQGLYEYRTAGLAETLRGKYYSRYSMNGRRTFRSLDTNVLEVAKLKHAQKTVEVAVDRQNGVGNNADFKTLGALFNEVRSRLDANPVKASTEIGRRANMARLAEHWQAGAFETFLARNVTADVIVRLREHLLGRAKWERRRHVGPANVGFGAAVTNQTLWVLRVMLDIGVEKKVIPHSPFAQKTALRGSLYATQRGEDKLKIALPSRGDMGRIFASMREVQVGKGFQPDPKRLATFAQTAVEMADHAELLATSGMRREEAQASTVADDRGDEFKIWGTKSASSERTIPVNPALRQVLDRIKGRRSDPAAKLCIHTEPRLAVRRACKRLGLPALRNHDFRHYFASVCIASGVDVPTVSRWLGHSDGGALAMKTYGHLMKDASQAAAARVDFNAPTAPATAG